jgi:hypothetical protein
MQFLKAPFLHDGRLHRGLLALFLAVNLLVAANALLHHPEIGYDANDHLLYMQVLPQRLPTDDDTREFFSPPLPYIVPALADEACLLVEHGPEAAAECRYLGGKTGQLINVLLALGATFLVLDIAELWRPGDVRFKLLTLFVLGALPVFYKTFSQFWGQPYVAFFSTLAIWQFLAALRSPNEISWRSGARLGISFGLLALSRQWGFLVIASIGGFAALLWLVSKERRAAVRVFKMVTAAAAVSFLVGSWFYFHLYATEGRFTAFNRNTPGFSLANKEASFYRATGLKEWRLFRSPVYGSFNDMFIPIFYSDIWGDYWGFYTLPNLTEEVLAIWDWDGSDYGGARSYLGRVNAVSLPLALLLGVGSLFGLGRFIQFLRRRSLEAETLFPSFVFFLAAVSMLGYLWFIISYPSSNGDTIKATYMIHIFIMLAFLAAETLEALRSKSPRLFYAALLICGAVVVHNLPAMLTRYVYIP